MVSLMAQPLYFIRTIAFVVDKVLMLLLQYYNVDYFVFRSRRPNMLSGIVRSTTAKLDDGILQVK